MEQCRFNDVAEEVHRLAGAVRVSGATTEDLATLGRDLGFAPYPEILEWLRLCSGASIGLYALLGTNRRHGQPCIADVMTPEWRAAHWIPIATDGCGNCYCVVSSCEHAPHPVAFVEATDPGAVQYLVASNLERFLRFYLSDVRGTFGGADTGPWPFDAGYVLHHDPELAEISEFPPPWSPDPE